MQHRLDLLILFLAQTGTDRHRCFHSSTHAHINTRVRYVCMYVRTSYVHTYIHAYVHTYIPTCIHACMHTYRHACMHTYIRTYTHAGIPRRSPSPTPRARSAVTVLGLVFGITTSSYHADYNGWRGRGGTRGDRARVQGEGESDAGRSRARE